MCINNSESCHGQTDDKHVLKEPFSVPESEVWAEKEKQRSDLL